MPIWFNWISNHWEAIINYRALRICSLRFYFWLLTLSWPQLHHHPQHFPGAPVITGMDCVCKIVLCLGMWRKVVTSPSWQEAPVCHNKTLARVSRVPSETCDLSPATICRRANKLVPHLEPQQQCADQPRQATPDTLLGFWHWCVHWYSHYLKPLIIHGCLNSVHI